MEKITIELDIEKKRIHKLDIPKDLSGLELVVILNQVQNSVLTQYEIKKDNNKIIKPKSKIIGRELL